MRDPVLPEYGWTPYFTDHYLIHKPIIQDVDIAWAAGLFEGEGCICRRLLDGKYLSWTLQLVMTDEDVVRKFCVVAGYGRVHRDANPTKRGCLVRWCWYVGTRKEVQRLLKLFLPYLGKRRAEKAHAALREIEDLLEGPSKE